MELLRRIFRTSLTRRLLVLLRRRLLPALRRTLCASFLWQCWLWTDRCLLNSRPVRILCDPTYLTNAFYASVFYRASTLGVRRLSFLTPRASLPWNSLWIGGYLAVVLLTPQPLCMDAVLLGAFFLPAVFYFSHHAQYRTGTVFATINLLLLLFYAALSLALPAAALGALCYLLLGIDLFFLVSFSIRSRADFIKQLRCIYALFLLLCGLGLMQQQIIGIPARAVFSDNIAFGDILVLLFPFAFIAPMTFESHAKRAMHIIPLLMLAFTVVTATQSRAALIGFSVELLLLILLIDWRYLPLLLFLAPVMTRTALSNIVQMWTLPKSYGSFLVNLIYAFRAFWNNGFGVSRGAFLDFYNSTALSAQAAQAAVSLPYLSVSPLYFSFLLELSSVALLLFFAYLLRLAHSTLTSVFTAQKEFRIFFAAGFATLVGISVSSLLESTLLSPRTMLTYWGMLGMLRAARIIRYGITR